MAPQLSILKSESVQVTGDDVGTYKVTLSNDLGEASTEGKLTLSGAPQFKEKIEDQKTAIDEPWKIVAQVTGELLLQNFVLFFSSRTKQGSFYFFDNS